LCKFPRQISALKKGFPLIRVIIKAGEYSTRDIVDNPVFGKDYVQGMEH